MMRFSAIYITGGSVHRMTFEAPDIEAAKAQAEKWGVGVEGEVQDTGPVRPALPEAFNLQDTCHMLGGIGRTLVYQMVNDGRLERVPRVRRLLITRRSIEKWAAGRS